MNLKDPGNMKELEERIINLWAQSTNDNTFTDLVAKEVKDISIEFAEKCFDEYADQEMSFSELFEQFIKQRYESNN
jgi:hypothetical protein